MNKHGRPVKGVVAVGVPVRAAEGIAFACVSAPMPSVRYDGGRLPRLVATLRVDVRDKLAEPPFLGPLARCAKPQL